MMDFLKTHYELVIGILFAVFIAAKVVTAFRKAKKIDKEGIETDAVVTRVEDTSSAEDATSSYSTYVEYRDENGELRESFMALTVNVQYEAGQKVRIKYIPGVHDMVREARK